MSIDTEITHVTRAGANIFAELGLGADEARQLQEQAKAQIAASIRPDETAHDPRTPAEPLLKGEFK